MTACELIKLARKHTGLSQANFALQTNISKSTLQKWERGIRSPNADDFLKCLEFANKKILKNIKKMLK